MPGINQMNVLRFARTRTMSCFMATMLPGAVPTMPVPDPVATRWAIMLPASEKVVFRGVVSFDKAGITPASMLYPAPNPAGLLVAVLTHAALAKGSREAQKTKITAEADKVLIPYHDVIEQFGYAELAQREKVLTTVGTQLPVIARGAEHPDTWVVLVNPVYSITQDQTAIVLDNAISIYAPGESRRASYANSVRVIADAHKEPDPVTSWLADNGELLKDESAHLLAESLEIAFTDAAATAPSLPTYKTLRYMEGEAERMERGQPISQHCDRVLLRSLRGSLMSVPIKRSNTAGSEPDCPSAQAAEANATSPAESEAGG